MFRAVAVFLIVFFMTGPGHASVVSESIQTLNAPSTTKSRFQVNLAYTLNDDESLSSAERIASWYGTTLVAKELGSFVASSATLDGTKLTEAIEVVSAGLVSVETLKRSVQIADGQEVYVNFEIVYLSDNEAVRQRLKEFRDNAVLQSLVDELRVENASLQQAMGRTAKSAQYQRLTDIRIENYMTRAHAAFKAAPDPLDHSAYNAEVVEAYQQILDALSRALQAGSMSFNEPVRTSQLDRPYLAYTYNYEVPETQLRELLSKYFKETGHTKKTGGTIYRYSTGDLRRPYHRISVDLMRSLREIAAVITPKGDKRSSIIIAGYCQNYCIERRKKRDIEDRDYFVFIPKVVNSDNEGSFTPSAFFSSGVMMREVSKHTGMNYSFALLPSSEFDYNLYFGK